MFDDVNQQHKVIGWFCRNVRQTQHLDVGADFVNCVIAKSFPWFDSGRCEARVFERFDRTADARSHFEEMIVGTHVSLKAVQKRLADFPRSDNAVWRWDEFPVVVATILHRIIQVQFRVRGELFVGNQSAVSTNNRGHWSPLPVEFGYDFEIGFLAQITRC